MIKNSRGLLIITYVGIFNILFTGPITLFKLPAPYAINPVPYVLLSDTNIYTGAIL